MTLHPNWLKIQPAFEWLNTLVGTGLGTPLNFYSPVFMLSRDPVGALTERVAGRHYIATEKLPNSVSMANNYAPAPNDILPSRMARTRQGNLRLSWSPSVPETIYPALDHSATVTSGPVQSFAVWIGEFSATQNSMGMYSRDKLAIAERYAKGPILYLTGTVGPKGSGADLELEDIPNWRPGRPIFLTGSELELPFRLIRGLGGAGSEVPSMERDGPHGNIAVPGLNGLTESSFSASGNSAGAHRAFNGWQGVRKTRESADPSDYDTLWATQTDSIGKDGGYRMTDHWLQVDFGEVVAGLTGVGLRTSPYNRYGRTERDYQSPRRYRVQTSMDGELFEDQLIVTSTDTSATLSFFPEAVSARFVRFAFETMHSAESLSRYFLSVCVAEVYQVGEATSPAI